MSSIKYKELPLPYDKTNRPEPGQVVIGFDECLKKEVVVQYRYDSNRFFSYPYTGAVYPKNRMYKWRES